MIEAMKMLKKYKNKIPKQTYKTIRGQIIAGDIDGAMRGLYKVVNRGNKDA